MTLEQLRTILRHQNTPSAVLTVLGVLGGAWSAAALVEATGKPRRSVYEALEDFGRSGLVPHGKLGYTLDWDAARSPQVKPSRLEKLSGPGFIYAMRAELSGLIKVGISTNPRSRLSCVAAKSGEPVTLICAKAVPKMLEAESEEHARLEPYAVGREWFRLDAQGLAGLIVRLS